MARCDCDKHFDPYLYEHKEKITTGYNAMLDVYRKCLNEAVRQVICVNVKILFLSIPTHSHFCLTSYNSCRNLLFK